MIIGMPLDLATPRFEITDRFGHDPAALAGDLRTAPQLADSLAA